MKNLQLLFALTIASTATAIQNWDPINKARQASIQFSQDNKEHATIIGNLERDLEIKELPFLIADEKIESLDATYNMHVLDRYQSGNIEYTEYCMVPKLKLGKRALGNLSKQEFKALAAANLAKLKIMMAETKKWWRSPRKICLTFIILSGGLYILSIPNIYDFEPVVTTWESIQKNIATFAKDLKNNSLSIGATAAGFTTAYSLISQQGKRNLTNNGDLDALKVLDGSDDLILALEQEEGWRQSSTGVLAAISRLQEKYMFNLFGSKPRLAERIKYLKEAAQFAK